MTSSRIWRRAHATNSTTWPRPRRRRSSGSISRSRVWVRSRRTGSATAWCRPPGARCFRAFFTSAYDIVMREFDPRIHLLGKRAVTNDAIGYGEGWMDPRVKRAGDTHRPAAPPRSGLLVLVAMVWLGQHMGT